MILYVLIIMQILYICIYNIEIDQTIFTFKVNNI